MRRWWQVATRNWRAKPVRTALATASVALGVAVVVWVTCCYESVRLGVTETVAAWIGRAQVTVESVGGRWALFDAKVADGLEATPNVLRMVTRTIETVGARPHRPNDKTEPLRVDIIGIDPVLEAEFRSYELADGRMLQPGDHHALLVEELLAREWGLAVGDRVELVYPTGQRREESFEIVGLVERRRVSSHQLPMVWSTIAAVQRLSGFDGKIKAVDFLLRDDSPAALRETAAAIRKHVRRQDSTLKVGTTEAQLKQLRAAQGQLQFVLMLISCVALLTAFFIILSTMSMSVVERIAQLGLLRCVGVTRAGVFGLVLVEMMPLAAVGVLVGIPIGLGLQWITIRLVPEYIGQMAYSGGGIALAVFGGAGTALLGALGPGLRAAIVSPIAATRSSAGRRGARTELIAAAVGVALLIAHHSLVGAIDAQSAHFAPLALGGLLTLYLGYALLTPLAVLVLGGPAEYIIAAVLRVRRQLVTDQVGRQPWRSAAVCSGLMVGLSLIVGLQVHSASVKSGWEFPKQFPEAMIYSWQDVPLKQMRAAAAAPGVRSATIADDVKCKLARRGGGFLGILDPFYRFIAADPDTFPQVIQLVYLEGDEAAALARLKRGGAVLATREFSQARNIHLGDSIELEVGDATATFEVAGVIASPAIDIAVSFFNAGGEFQVYAVGSFIGTLDDARRCFGRDNGRLLLFNFDLPETSAGAGFQKLSEKPKRDAAGQVIPQAEGHLRTAAETSGTDEEKKIVQEMINRLDSPQCAYVTARQLKQSIDDGIDRVTLLLAAIPTVGLIVAALGVANLMMANVASRARQIAVLRAVGMTQFQVVRLVAAEALILGLLGGGLGLIMGLHLARSSNALTLALWGFEPRFDIPWPMVLAGAGLAAGLCLLAGVAPARMAARGNIAASLQAV